MRRAIGEHEAPAHMQAVDGDGEGVAGEGEGEGRRLHCRGTARSARPSRNLLAFLLLRQLSSRNGALQRTYLRSARGAH